MSEHEKVKEPTPLLVH